MSKYFILKRKPLSYSEMTTFSCFLGGDLLPSLTGQKVWCLITKTDKPTIAVWCELAVQLRTPSHLALTTALVSTRTPKENLLHFTEFHGATVAGTHATHGRREKQRQLSKQDGCESRETFAGVPLRNVSASSVNSASHFKCVYKKKKNA